MSNLVVNNNRAPTSVVLAVGAFLGLTALFAGKKIAQLRKPIDSPVVGEIVLRSMQGKKKPKDVHQPRAKSYAVHYPPVDLKKPVAEVEIPDSLKATLAPEQLKQLEEDCRKKFLSSMEEMQKLLPNVLLANDKVKECASELGGRLLQFLECYCKIKNKNLLEVLAKLYTDAAAQTRTYLGNPGKNPEDILEGLKAGNIRVVTFLLSEASKNKEIRQIFQNKELVDAINKEIASQESVNHPIWGKRAAVSDPYFGYPGIHARETEDLALRKFKESDAQRRTKAIEEYRAATPTIREMLARSPIPISYLELRHILNKPILPDLSNLTDEDKDRRIGCDAAVAVFNPTTFSEKQTPYLCLAQKYGLGLTAGPSNSADQLISIAAALGMNTERSLSVVRLLS